VSPHSQRRPSRGLAVALVLAGFVLYLVMNHAAFWNVYRGFEMRGVRRTVMMAGYLSTGYVAFLPLLLSTRRVGVALFSVAVGASVLANFIHSSIFHGSLLTAEVVDWLVAESGQAPNAWSEFWLEMTASLVGTLLTMAAFVQLRGAIQRTDPRARALARGPIAVVPALAFLAFQAVPLVRPMPFALAEANLFIYGVPALFGTAPEPRNPTVGPDGSPLAEKIALVVDESVTYVAYQSAIAPALEGFPVLDYGEAASIANCSSQTNALLRWGVERPAIGSDGYDPRATPHLWGYARAAGMRTTLIDGQSSGAPQNFLGPGELGQLDEVVHALRGFETDRSIAALLNERLRRPGREFVFVVKRGAHFPFRHACAPGTVSPQASKPEQHAAAVRCSSERFFETVAQDVDFSRVLLVYTSDHGQDFDNARSTHCNPIPGPGEYSVPLVVLTRAGPLERLLRAALPAMQGHASHANIFPTLLHAMGYPRAWNESLHGPTLAGPPAGLLTLQVRLPFPHWREPIVRFSNGSTFPGREPRAQVSIPPEPADGR